MISRNPILAAAVMAALLAGCEQKSTPAPATQPAATPAAQAAAPAAAAVATPAAGESGESVATVNGKAISKAELQGLKDELAMRGMADRVSEAQLLDELIKRELLRQEADAQHLDATPEVAARLSNLRRAVLAHAAGQAYLKANAPTDDAVKQEYDRQVASNKATEYKARHILVKTEKEAKDIIKKLQAGAKFEDLAKKHSTDPGSAKNGGDLGWFMPQQMVAQFSEAVTKLENGKFTAAPVKTQFGWHVIQREGSRDKAPPPFDAVKDQVKESLQNSAMQKYLENLQAKAKVERNEAALTPAPAAPAAGAPAGQEPAAEEAPGEEPVGEESQPPAEPEEAAPSE